MRKTAIAALCIAGIAVAACEREQRTLQQPPSASQAVKAATMNPVVGGGAPAMPNPYEENAQALADGKRLYEWFNCSGCHATNGGGDKGPALMDDVWIYGSEPADIVATILQGRPNGMPSFSGRMPEHQAWQLAAYVRSLSGLVRKDAATSRSDTLTGGPAENRMDPQAPKTSNSPKQ